MTLSLLNDMSPQEILWHTQKGSNIVARQKYLYGEKKILDETRSTPFPMKRVENYIWLW